MEFPNLIAFKFKWIENIDDHAIRRKQFIYKFILWIDFFFVKVEKVVGWMLDGMKMAMIEY